MKLQALCWGAGAELCATDGSIGTCKGALSQLRWPWKDRDTTSHLSFLGLLKDDGHGCLQPVQLHLSPSYGPKPTSCFHSPNHNSLLVSAACKGLQGERAAFEVLTVMVGRTRQNCCPACRKGGVCKLNKCVKFIIITIMASVDGGRLGHCRTGWAQAGSAPPQRVSLGHPKSRGVSQGLFPADQIRGYDFHSAHLHTRLLQTCVSAAWQYLYLLCSHFSFLREFLKLPRANRGQPVLQSCWFRNVLPQEGFGTLFCWPSPIPFPPDLCSAITPCSW